MVVMKKYCNKFTLVEILAVVALIGILTAIGFGAYTYAMNSAKESSTKALIKRLESGLESCRTKFGYFPASKKKNNDDDDEKAYVYLPIKITVGSDNIVTEIEIGSLKSDPRTKGEYGEAFMKVVDAESFKKYVKNNELQDGWGGTIYYKYPGTINKTGFDLVSAGADGKFGNDTVTDRSKPASDRTGYYPSATATEKDCDDITNF